MHYSLYYESFKNDNFENARSDLLWILENAPGLPKNDARNYRRAVKMYEGLAENSGRRSWAGRGHSRGSTRGRSGHS